MDALTSTAPERIWLYGFPRTDGGQDVNYHERPKWMPSEPAATSSVPYIRADLAGQETPQWKPIAEMPEELKDGREVDLFCEGTRVTECKFRESLPREGRTAGAFDPAPTWRDCLGIPMVDVTHYMEVPTAPQAEAEEGE